MSEQLEAARADAKEAEAYAEGLEKELVEWRADSAAGWDNCEEHRIKLAKAVEALRAVDALDPEGMIDGCSQYALRGLVLRMGEISRATLAEIEGSNAP